MVNSDPGGIHRGVGCAASKAGDQNRSKIMHVMPSFGRRRLRRRHYRVVRAIVCELRIFGKKDGAN